MASSFINPDAPDQIYKWIERKPLTEAVLWTPREKFYIIACVLNYGCDWNIVVRILKKVGEPYRPKEWYSPTSCERQFKVILNSQTNEVKSMEPRAMLKHMYDIAIEEFKRDLQRSHDNYVAKYSTLNGVMKRMMQGNLSRNEVNSLYSQVRRTEIEGKQYMEQLRTRQNACLASENSGSSEESIKWNSPSAPLLTSLLRSRNTIPANRNTTPITSQFQSPSGTSRTRSGKLLPLSPSVVKTNQGTPTLSKLLEAPANPYIPSPSQSAQKIKQREIIGTDRLNGSNSKKENSQSPSLNKVRVDSIMTGPFSQLNKSDLSYSKRNTSRSPVSAVKNGSKASSSVVNLLSDSENEEDKSPSQNIHSKNIFIFGEKKENIGSPRRIEPRATRSQTRADGGFKQLNDNGQSDEKNESDVLSQQIEGSQMNKGGSIDDDIIDIDQIEIEPLSTVQDEITISSKVTRSSTLRLAAKTPADNLSTSKANCKEINNQMLEEISTNFVLNSPAKNVAADYKNLMVGQSRIENTNITGCFIPVDSSTLKDAMILQKDGQCFPSSNNTLTTFDGKVLRQKKLIEFKSASIRCFDGKNDQKILTLTNQPIVVVNKIKKPFNIKLAPEVKNKTDITSFDPLKAIRYQSGSQNLVQLLDGRCSLSDEVIIIDDDVNINVNDGQKESSKSEPQIMSLNTTVGKDSSSVLKGSKTTSVQLDKKTNDKTLWNLIGKSQNLIDISSQKFVNQDVLSKTETESNLQETNNRFIKELDFDFEQSASISDFYNGVEEIVEMHSFNNEDLNSLIESGSLDESEPEKHQNILDQGDSFVSEGDSTIGAFDTFAQITRVAQKPVSKDIKSVSREPKTVKKMINVLEHKDFVHVEENEDHSSTVSVTGIPILQGVISDVMSKINSDRVAALNKSEDSKSVPLNDIVEISSDEDTVCNEVTILNVVEQSRTQECDKVDLKKLNEDKSQTIYKLAPGLKDDNNKFETNKLISKNIANNIYNEINKLDKINDKNITFNASKKCVTNKVDEVENIQQKTEIELNEDNPKLNKSKSEHNIEYIEKRKEIDELKNETELKSQFDSNSLKQIELMMNKKKSEESPSTEIAERKKQKENQREVINMEVKETKTKDFEAEIMLRSKQNDERKAKAFEMTKVKESEIKITKEVEKPRKSKINEDEQFQKCRELEVTNIKKDGKYKDKAVEMQRETEEEVNLQNAKEAEIQNADASCIQIAKEAELLKSNNAANVQRESDAKGLKNTELKNFKEAEILKSNEGRIRKQADEIKEGKSKECESKNLKTLAGKKIAEAELNEKSAKMKEIEFVKLIDNAEFRKNVALIKKSTEDELKSKSEETEGKLQKEQEKLTSEEQVKITKKSEQSAVDTKNVKDSSKEIESKMQEQQKVAENEENQNIDAQIITRTRGSKVEDKLKESNFVTQNVPFKQSVVLLKPYVPPKSDVLLTNPVLKNENKYNPTTHEFPCNSSINSSESLNKVGNKLRTRSSSSFKQSKVEEIKSSSLHKSNDQNEPYTVQKASFGTKTKISTTLDQEIPTSSSNFQHKLNSYDIDSSLKSLPDNNGKKLRVSVEILSADAVPSLREIDDQHSNNTSIKPSKVKANDNEHLPQIIVDINEKSDKPGPKKRGRKRRIDVQNEDLSKSKRDKLSLQNGATAVIITPSTSEVEPPAKRTRKSIESHDSNIMSLERTKKKILKMFYDGYCDGNQLLLTFEKQIKNACPDYHAIIKDRSTPLELRDIKENIDSGEILELPDLQVKLFMMCMNTVMLNVNKSSPAVTADDATNFILHELPKHFPSLPSIVNEDDELDQNKKNLKKNNENESADIDVQLNYKELEFSDDCNSVQSEDDYDKVKDYVSTLSDCYSDIDSNHESLLLNDKEKETDSDSSSNYDDDSDHYNSKFF